VALRSRFCLAIQTAHYTACVSCVLSNTNFKIPRNAASLTSLLKFRHNGALPTLISKFIPTAATLTSLCCLPQTLQFRHCTCCSRNAILQHIFVYSFVRTTIGRCQQIFRNIIFLFRCKLCSLSALLSARNPLFISFFFPSFFRLCTWSISLPPSLTLVD